MKTPSKEKAVCKTCQLMEPEAMADVLGKFQHYLPDLFLVHQVCGAGDAVADGFDWRNELLMHDPRGVQTVRIGAESEAVDSQEPPKEIW